jgi:hypothetical protein
MKDAILGVGARKALVQKLKNDSRLVSILERVERDFPASHMQGCVDDVYECFRRPFVTKFENEPDRSPHPDLLDRPPDEKLKSFEGHVESR